MCHATGRALLAVDDPVARTAAVHWLADSFSHCGMALLHDDDGDWQPLATLRSLPPPDADADGWLVRWLAVAHERTLEAYTAEDAMLVVPLRYALDEHAAALRCAANLLTAPPERGVMAAARAAAGWSTRTAAAWAGVTVRQWQHWEQTATRTPPEELRAALSRLPDVLAAHRNGRLEPDWGVVHGSDCPYCRRSGQAPQLRFADRPLWEVDHRYDELPAAVNDAFTVSCEGCRRSFAVGQGRLYLLPPGPAATAQGTRAEAQKLGRYLLGDMHALTA